MEIAIEKLNFSSREMEVLNLVKMGLSSKEIGKILNMSEDSVDSYRRNMLKKAGARNMVAVVYAAKSFGLI